VQDGCDYPCSYCTIPLARGKSRSDTIDNIVKAAQDIAARDVKEIVLTGVNIGDFGLQNGERKETFLDLVNWMEISLRLVLTILGRISLLKRLMKGGTNAAE
jgi:threonylcarbamoyladenosine tRNA methylthiotransferase MtaB